MSLPLPGLFSSKDFSYKGKKKKKQERCLHRLINNVVKLIWQHFILCKRQVPFAEKYSIPFPFLPFFFLSVQALPSREKPVLCLNGSDCLPWEDRKPRMGDGERHTKKFLLFSKSWGKLPALLAAPAELCGSVSPGTHTVPLQL